METSVDNAVLITKATCILHNMVIDEEGVQSLNGSLGDETGENIQPPHEEKRSLQNCKKCERGIHRILLFSRSITLAKSRDLRVALHKMYVVWK